MEKEIGHKLLSQSDEKDGWQLFHFPFPRISRKGGEKKAWDLRLQLQYLFRLIMLLPGLDILSSAEEKQLLYVDIMLVAAEMKGGLFSVTVCPPFDAWVAAQNANNLRIHEGIILGHMRAAALTLWPGLKQDWGIRIEPDRRIQMGTSGGIVLASDLSWWHGDTLGQIMTSDNIDGSYHQLVLLMGVAALADAGRRAGAGRS